MKILFAASEAYPFFTSGGLGDVAGSLPAALKQNDASVRVILPLYGDLRDEWRKKLRYITNFTVSVGWRNQYCGLFELSHNGVTHYFLDNEYYFKRHGLYGFYDDGERFSFFSRAVLEALFHIDFTPDIIHCHDWQTALISVYVNLYYRNLEKFANIKTVFTIHNLQYQGHYGFEILEETVGIGRKDAHLLEYDRDVIFLKGALECSDKITTVSPTYAQEILDPWYGHGMETFLQKKAYKLCGIINGIDTNVYNPATDSALAKNYDINTVAEGKALCKRDLQREFELSESDGPLIGMVSRLVDHKGFDLVCQAADDLIDAGFQFVLLGSGEYRYEHFFKELALRHPGQVGVRIGFIPALARKIYAGADLFLMPSKTEPCGLSQLVALRYGTVPIVRFTGGLHDTILDSFDGQGNGFVFSGYNAYEMQEACLRAKQEFADTAGWQDLIQRGMNCDFSWNRSALQYLAMYKEVLSLW